jgi:hypothetical protein
MYIPLLSSNHPGDATLKRYGLFEGHSSSSRANRSATTITIDHLLTVGGSLLKRQFSENGTENANIRTGVILGVVLGLALIALCVFCFFYGTSIRFRRKKRKHHHHRYKSSSSKSSKSSVGPPPPDGDPAGGG